MAGLDFFGILFSQGIRSQSSKALIRTLNIYGLYHGWNLPNAADATEKLKTQSAAGFRSVWMAASDEAASDEVQLALAALTERSHYHAQRDRQAGRLRPLLPRLRMPPAVRAAPADAVQDAA